MRGPFLQKQNQMSVISRSRPQLLLFIAVMRPNTACVSGITSYLEILQDGGCDELDFLFYPRNCVLLDLVPPRCSQSVPASPTRTRSNCSRMSSHETAGEEDCA